MVHTMIWTLIKAFRVTLKKIHETSSLKTEIPLCFQGLLGTTLFIFKSSKHQHSMSPLTFYVKCRFLGICHPGINSVVLKIRRGSISLNQKRMESCSHSQQGFAISNRAIVLFFTSVKPRAKSTYMPGFKSGKCKMISI